MKVSRVACHGRALFQRLPTPSFVAQHAWLNVQEAPWLHQVMNKICRESEASLDYYSLFKAIMKRAPVPMSPLESLASSAVRTAHKVRASCIIIPKRILFLLYAISISQCALLLCFYHCLCGQSMLTSRTAVAVAQAAAM